MNFFSTVFRKKLRATYGVIFLCTLSLGFLQSLSFVVQGYFQTESQTLLGADIVIESSANLEEIEPEVFTSVLTDTTVLSRQLEMTTLVIADEQDQSVLASLRVIDDLYPLYGEVVLAEKSLLDITQNDIVLDQNLAEQLDVTIGQTVRIGEASFTVKDLLIVEPDAQLSFQFGRTALLSPVGFAQTGIDIALSRVKYRYVFRIDPLQSLTLFSQELDVLLDGQRYDSDRYDSGTSRTSRILQNIKQFVIIVVCISLFLALVAIYFQMRAMIQSALRDMALMLVLGMNRLRLLLQIVLVCIRSLLPVIVAGIVLSQLIVWFTLPLLNQVLQTDLAYSIPWAVILQCVSVIVIMIVIALLWPLMELARLRSIDILRNTITLSSPVKQWKVYTLAVICALLFAALYIILQSAWLALLLMVSITSIWIIVIVSLWGGLRFVPTLDISSPPRFAALLLKRQFIFTLLVGGTIAFVSMLLSSIVLIQSNLLLQVNRFLGDSGPNLILVDIQKDQQAEVTDFIDVPVDFFPSLRSRITAVNEVQFTPENESERDGELSRAFNITYRDNLDVNETLVAGEWWEAGSTEPEVSMDLSAAQRFGFSLGDILTFDIQGRKIDFPVTSFREIEVQDGMPFFYFVMPYEVLKDAPSSIFAFVEMDPEDIPAFQREITRKFPNVTPIDTAYLQSIVTSLTLQVRNTIYAVASLSYVMAFFVIVALFRSVVRQRQRLVALMKVYGASQAYIGRVFQWQIVYLCIFGSLWGVMLASIATYQINVWIFDITSFAFSPFVFVALFLFILLFFIVSRRANRQILPVSPMVLLQSRS